MRVGSDMGIWLLIIVEWIMVVLLVVLAEYGLNKSLRR